MSIRSRKNKDGTRSYYVLVHDPKLGRNTYVGSTRSAREAKQMEMLAKEDIRRGRRPRDKVTVKQLSQEFMSTRCALRANSINVYWGDLRAIGEFFGEDTLLTDIERRDVDQFIVKMVEAGVAPESVHRRATRLKQILTLAVDYDYIVKSPAPHRYTNLPPKKRLREPMVLTPAQHQQLVKAAPKHLRALFYIWPFAGGRVSEMLALTIEDVDFREGTLRIERQVQRGQLTENKTDRSKRTILLPPSCLPVLRKHIDKYLDGVEHGFLFPRKGNSPYSYACFFEKVWQPVVIDAGLPDLKSHDLRHSSGAWLLRAGASLLYVSRHLGHSNINMTANVYGHLLDEHKMEYAEKVDAWASENAKNSDDD